MPLLFVLLLLIPSVTFAQSGSSVQLGDSTFYNVGGISGSSQSIGDMEFYSFSNGISATRSRIGDIDFYSSSTPSLSDPPPQWGTSRLGPGGMGRQARNS